MTKNTGTGGFWTTLPGILTGIGGVLTAVVAIIQVLRPDGDSPSNTNSSPAASLTSPPANLTSPAASLTSFVVEANDSKGFKYTNLEDGPIKIEYKAKKNGRWVAIPEDYPKDNLPKGDLSLDGDRDFPANRNMPCPGGSIGELVVLRHISSRDHQCVSSGSKGTFSLDSLQTAYFLMNDVNGLYSDNRGSATVELYIVK